MGKKLEKNALSKLTLASSCQIDLGNSITSVDNSNYKNNIVWRINHKNIIQQDSNFLLQKWNVLDYSEPLVVSTNPVQAKYDYLQILGDKVIFPKIVQGVTKTWGLSTLDIFNTAPVDAIEKRRSIKEIYVPYGYTVLGNALFSYTNVPINIPSTVVTISDGCFFKCENPKIEVPGTVTNIGTRAFSGIVNPVDIILNEGLVQIGSAAFFNNKGLTEITIPSTVTTIDGNAFASCANLATITINNVEGAIAGAETAWGCPNTNVQIIYTKE